MPRQILALALLLTACEPDDTILPGDDPCGYESRAVGSDDATIGVTAEEGLALTGTSTFEADLVDGGTVAVTIGASAPADGATLYESASGECSAYLGVPVELVVSTADGLLDGVWTVELDISLEDDLPVAMVWLPLEPGELASEPDLLEGERLLGVAVSAAWTPEMSSGQIVLQTETVTETAVEDSARTLMSWATTSER